MPSRHDQDEDDYVEECDEDADEEVEEGAPDTAKLAPGEYMKFNCKMVLKTVGARVLLVPQWAGR